MFLSEGMVYYGTPVERRGVWANTFEDLMSTAEKANVDGRTASWPVWVTTSDARRAQIVAECNRRAASVIVPKDSAVSSDMRPEVTNLTDFGS